MPYTAQTKTLNPDELSKLYNMNPYNRPVVSPNMVNYPNMQSGISLVHQQNPSQMSLAQSSLNTAQYMTTMPYIQQGNDRLYTIANSIKLAIHYEMFSKNICFFRIKL